VAAGVVVVLGAEPPVGAELPPASPVFAVAGVDDDAVPVVSDEPVDDDVSLELELSSELESVESLASELVESPVVPVSAVSGEVVPVAVPDAFSSLARLDDAVGSVRLGIVCGTGSETWAPPQPARTSAPRSAPSNAAGLASLGNASLRLGPCGARRSGSR
jgi:hypothetical protein